MTADVNEISRELIEIMKRFNSEGCPICGGFYQCKIRLRPDSYINITFEQNTCRDYMHAVHNAVNEVIDKYNLPRRP